MEASEPTPPNAASSTGETTASTPVWEVPPASGTPVWEIPPAGQSTAGVGDVQPGDRPEIAAGVAFVGGLVVAMILRRIAS